MDSASSERQEPSSSGMSFRYSLGGLLVFVAGLCVLLTVLFVLVPEVIMLADATARTSNVFTSLIYFILDKRLNLVPELLVWVVGAVIVFRRRQRHPNVSRCALLGLSGFILITIVNLAFLHYLGPNAPFVPSPGILLIYQFHIACFQPLVAAASWCLVLIAVLGWRQTNLNS